MADLRSVLVLSSAGTLVVLGLALVNVLNVGIAAAWRGDTGTVGSAVLVLMLVAVASLLGGAIGGDR